MAFDGDFHRRRSLPPAQRLSAARGHSDQFAWEGTGIPVWGSKSDQLFKGVLVTCLIEI
jgi:hypothetical protein